MVCISRLPLNPFISCSAAASPSTKQQDRVPSIRPKVDELLADARATVGVHIETGMLLAHRHLHSFRDAVGHIPFGGRWVCSFSSVCMCCFPGNVFEDASGAMSRPSGLNIWPHCLKLIFAVHSPLPPALTDGELG